MDLDSAKVRLLETGSLASSDGQEQQQDPYGHGMSCMEKLSQISIKPTLLCCLLLSLIANVILSAGSKGRNSEVLATCPSRYSGLRFNVGIPYHSQSDYWGDNETLADLLWENIDTSPMVVALPYTEAFSRGLSWSVPWVWDDEKGVYLIKAFHSVHCLKLVRKAVKDYAFGRPDPVPIFHVDHCLDSLRQDIMCKADDTPMPSINQPHRTGDGQIMECQDWDALVAWARRPDHHSCFEHINEYKDPVNKLEQFAFCPEGHPSRAVAAAYFEKFGHKDAFGA